LNTHLNDFIKEKDEHFLFSLLLHPQIDLLISFIIRYHLF
jgi:hypothetical protein